MPASPCQPVHASQSVLCAAKRIFSPLFHINSHPNYSVIDVFTDYYNEKMKQDAPEVYQYLFNRHFSNKTGKDYAFEPHDERHEEFNKRGLNLQKVSSLETFKSSFKIVDQVQKMAENCLDEYNVKLFSNSSHYMPDYSRNVHLMRVAMREADYLNKPERASSCKSITGEEINDVIMNLKSFSQDQKRSNISTLGHS